MVHVLLNPGLENFEYYYASMWDECNCVVVWAFFGIALLCDIGMKTDLFESCGHCWVFQICWYIECSTLTALSFRIWNGSAGILPLPGASVRNSAHGKGHEEGGLAYAKAWSSLGKPRSRASTPKPESIYCTVPCSRLHLWLYGGLFPTGSLREGVNVQLQGNKNSWAWQECFSLRTPLKVI